MYKNKEIISIGNFLFKHRNYLFPLMILVVFIICPPQNSFLGNDSLAGIKEWAALAMCLIGLGIRAAVIGFAYIKRGGLNKKVYADNLVVTGIFAICRNPLYVANVIIYSGIFLMNGSLEIFLFGTALFIFVYICIIAAEENYLREKFGAEFDQYCAKTPRWLPKLLSLKGAVSGMEFDFQKVILKDYTTIFNTMAIIIAIELYEQIQSQEGNNLLLVALIILMAAAMTVIKIYKKKLSQARLIEENDE